MARMEGVDDQLELGVLELIVPVDILPPPPGGVRHAAIGMAAGAGGAPSETLF